MSDKPSLNPYANRCTAKAKGSQRQCRNIAMANGKCRMHGGKTNPEKLSESMKGNRNGVVTGEYESIFLDVLDDDELHIFNNATTKVIESLEESIKLATIRERRMMVRINNLRDMDVNMVRTSEEESDDGMVHSIKFKKENREALISRIEEALTRVSTSKVRMIEQKHKIELSQGTGLAADITSYIDALQVSAEDVWSDVKDNMDENKGDE